MEGLEFGLHPNECMAGTKRRDRRASVASLAKLPHSTHQEMAGTLVSVCQDVVGFLS